MNRRVVRKKTADAKKSPAMSFRLPPIFRSSVKGKTVQPQSHRSHSEAERGEIGLFHLLFIVMSLLVAAAGALYHLHVRFEGVHLGYEASEQRKIQTRLMLQRRELRLELASMKEPGRIEDEAREKLGMETPRAEEFVHINKSQKVVSVSGGAL